MIRRYSSRQAALNGSHLGQTFLNEKLKKAKKYDRIAGYFSPSILEIAGEEIGAIEKVRVIANSKVTFGRLQINDQVAESARKEALWQEWCEQDSLTRQVPGTLLERLFHLLQTKRLEVRILPDDRFGLIHGKAGVITYQDQTQTCFMGSANESFQGWKLNYELVWEDDTQEGIAWVQKEFDTLWGDPYAFALTRRIIEDVLRNAKRQVRSVVEWQNQPEPAAPVVESPVYRRQLGFWPHQKYFIQRAFQEHRKYEGARLILADQVGLGKTIQLAMAAQLMALFSNRPVLVIVPQTLMAQWQTELWTLLEMPSAYWNGQCWVDEFGVQHEKHDRQTMAGIRKCPRLVGIVSQGLIFRRSVASEQLLKQDYACVVIDEAHRARRRGQIGGRGQRFEKNNLLQFIFDIAPKTKSVLLATATPVQLNPLEVWDLLAAIGANRDDVLGIMQSPWWDGEVAMQAAMNGKRGLNDQEFWNWMRSPFPPEDEPTVDQGMPFRAIRDSIGLKETDFTAKLSDFDKFDPVALNRFQDLKAHFFTYHNPFIRKIVRRTREFLENSRDPETGLPLLEKVNVRLFGEDKDEAIELTGYLEDAYQSAREFCHLLGKKKKGSGFMETLLLRRIGSSIIAGKETAYKLLKGLREDEAEEETEEDLEFEEENLDYSMETNSDENALLTQIIKALDQTPDQDPKFARVREILEKGANGSERWLDRGCIIFSQYYASANWLAVSLSEVFSELTIGLYAGSNKSALINRGISEPVSRELIKDKVRSGEIILLVGTDAASEGLNLQALGSLINLDLPWNPTRLEQRKGRIQRIGQRYNEIYVYNMRYRNSVEDDVHEALSERLAEIHKMFGQIPDTLEDVWVSTALGSKEEARFRIDAIPKKHPFDLKYNSDVRVIGQSWETCSDVLNKRERLDVLRRSW